MNAHDHAPAGQHHHQHRHHPGDESRPDGGSAAMIELLDLDAEVLHAYLADVTDWVYDLAADLPCRLILDLGSGTGTGALALAQRFQGADVVAVDVSAEMLERLKAKAGMLGVADRIRTVQADLDAAWPGIDTMDLVWASASLHHMADPDRLLADVFDAIRPGGILVVVELDSFPRFLPDDVGIGRPGLEARCHAAVDACLAEEMPQLGSDWGPRLSGAGFDIEAVRHFAIELAPPLPSSARRYAQVSLQRLRSGLDGQASADDLATLDALMDSVGPNSVLRRDDLSVRAARTAWVARRPR
jgi:SAM-dependent methyltransferase